MANYQNNMRYSRMGTACSQQRQNYSNMIGRESNAYNSTTARDVQRCENCTERQIQTELVNENYNTEQYNEDYAGMPLGMAYVPWQRWRDVYDICKGFHRGTIFRELDKPFLGKGGCNR